MVTNETISPHSSFRRLHNIEPHPWGEVRRGPICFRFTDRGLTWHGSGTIKQTKKYISHNFRIIIVSLFFRDWVVENTDALYAQTEGQWHWTINLYYISSLSTGFMSTVRERKSRSVRCNIFIENERKIKGKQTGMLTLRLLRTGHYVQNEMTQTPGRLVYHLKLNGAVSKVKILILSQSLCQHIPTPGTKLHYHMLISAAYRNSSSHKLHGNWMRRPDNYNSMELSDLLIHISFFLGGGQYMTLIPARVLHLMSKSNNRLISSSPSNLPMRTTWRKTPPWWRKLSEPLLAYAELTPAYKVGSLALRSP